jgi:hypothetical protein
MDNRESRRERYVMASDNVPNIKLSRFNFQTIPETFKANWPPPQLTSKFQRNSQTNPNNFLNCCQFPILFSLNNNVLNRTEQSTELKLGVVFAVLKLLMMQSPGITRQPPTGRL